MGQQAFPKHRRLRKRREYRQAYDEGTPYRNAGFHLFVRPREDRQPARLGITATRACGNAVVRNRLRRWVREYYRKRQFRPGIDLVVNIHRNMAQSDHENFDRLLGGVMHKAGILKKTADQTERQGE